MILFKNNVSYFSELYIRVAHFFGLLTHIQFQHDIFIELPTHYNDDAYDAFDSKVPDWIIKDVIKLTYQKLKEDSRLEYHCNKVGKVYVQWHENDWINGRYICYKDGLLFTDDKEYTRHTKLDELLN